MIEVSRKSFPRSCTVYSSEMGYVASNERKDENYETEMDGS